MVICHITIEKIIYPTLYLSFFRHSDIGICGYTSSFIFYLKLMTHASWKEGRGIRYITTKLTTTNNDSRLIYYSVLWINKPILFGEQSRLSFLITSKKNIEVRVSLKWVAGLRYIIKISVTLVIVKILFFEW